MHEISISFKYPLYPDILFKMFFKKRAEPLFLQGLSLVGGEWMGSWALRLQ